MNGRLRESQPPTPNGLLPQCSNSQVWVRLKTTIQYQGSNFLGHRLSNVPEKQFYVAYDLEIDTSLTPPLAWCWNISKKKKIYIYIQIHINILTHLIYSDHTLILEHFGRLQMNIPSFKKQPNLIKFYRRVEGFIVIQKLKSFMVWNCLNWGLKRKPFLWWQSGPGDLGDHGTLSVWSRRETKRKQMVHSKDC